MGWGTHGTGMGAEGWVPAFAGTTIVVAGTTGGVVFGESAGHVWIALCEQAPGVHPVAVFEAGKLARDGLVKELGDEPSAVGVLHDDVGEGACLELDELC